MADLLRPRAETQPRDLALADETGELTWAELDGRVNRWIRLLRDRGLAEGDRIALLTGNHRHTYEALLACVHAGLTVVPVNWHLTASEISYLLADSAAQGMIVDPAHAGVAAAALGESPGGRRLLVVTGERAWPGFQPVEPLLRAAGSAEPAAQSSGSLLLYTSGTSGQPKGVVGNLLHTGAPLERVSGLVRLLSRTVGLPSHGRNLLAGPWYHSGQLFLSLFPLLNGCALIVPGQLTGADLLAAIDRHRITTTHLVPTHLIRLLRLPEPVRSAFRGDSLELVWHGGAPCPVPVKRDLLAWWGPVLREYYASTEGGMVTTIDSAEWLRKPGSVGRPVNSAKVLIVADDGTEQPPGRPGRIYLCRTPGRGFRYHNAPEKTARAHLRPGTYTFGDSGFLDEDGYLYLTGRTDDTIISGGVNIYPAEVEAALLSHPAVHDAAVFGVPDEEFGEQVAAAVQLAAAELPPDLDAHCREQLAGFKVPRRYWIVPALPRDGNGKLRKRLLRLPGTGESPTAAEPA